MSFLGCPGQFFEEFLINIPFRGVKLRISFAVHETVNEDLPLFINTTPITPRLNRPLCMNQSAINTLMIAREELLEATKAEDFQFDLEIMKAHIMKIRRLMWLYYPEESSLHGVGKSFEKEINAVRDSSYNNLTKAKNLSRVIDNLISDVKSRVDYKNPAYNQVQELTDKMAHLEGQLNRTQYELTNAENEKAKLRKQIQHLESNRTKESELGKYQKTVVDHERLQMQKENEQIRNLKDDYQLLQADILQLIKAKETLEGQLEKRKHETGETLLTGKFPADLSLIILQKLQASGLRPEQFTRRVTNAVDHIAYGIHYQNSPMYFNFHQRYDERNMEAVSFIHNTPKYPLEFQHVKRNDPTEAYVLLEQWLNSHLLDYRNKFDKGDPWEEAIAGSTNSNTFTINEEPFQESEIEFLKRRLDVLESVAASQIDLHTDEIEKLKSAIEGLKDQLSKLSKPIWRRVATSVLQEVATTAMTDPEKTRKMFEVVKGAFEGTTEIFGNLLNP